MPIEHKPHRASSSVLAHLDGLLDEALEQTFPASDAVAIDFERESDYRNARVLEFPHSARWQPDGLKDCTENTNACPPALERLLAAEMRSKLTVALMHAATFWPESRLFKV